METIGRQQGILSSSIERSMELQAKSFSVELNGVGINLEVLLDDYKHILPTCNVSVMRLFKCGTREKWG